MALPRDVHWTRASAAKLVAFVGFLVSIAVLGSVGVLPMRWAAVLMLVASTGAMSVHIAGPADARHRSRREMSCARAMAVLVSFVAIGSVASVLFPPDALVVHEISEQGQLLPLPLGAHGRVRVSLRARFGATRSAVATVWIAGTEPAVKARFDRTVLHIKGSGGTHVRTRDDARSFLVSIPEGVTQLEVRALDGYPTPSIRLSIFQPTRAFDGHGPFVAVALVCLLVVALVASRVRMPELAVPAAAATLGYGLLIRYGAESELTVRGLLGGLVGCIVGGGVGGWLLGLLVRVLAGRASAAPRPRARGR